LKSIYILAAALLLTGCGASQVAAPVRDAKPAYAQVTYPPAPAGQHRVQPGDTLYKIAFEHGVDYRQLAAWNGIADPGRIRGGDTLRLSAPRPPVTTAPLPGRAEVETRELVRPPETRHPTATKPPPAEPAVAPSVVLNEPQDAPPDAWAWPAKGELLARFGQGRSKGVDIAGQGGQAVQAAASGRVVYAGSGLRGYGKLIIIRHGQTLLSAYAHNARIHVAEGQKVTRGQLIADMGDSDADQVKLHFEIRESGKPVDPLGYLPKTG
jgi:lipoprotein NlpD